jgi:hypothetical protein
MRKDLYETTIWIPTDHKRMFHGINIFGITPCSRDFSGEVSGPTIGLGSQQSVAAGGDHGKGD